MIKAVLKHGAGTYQRAQCLLQHIKLLAVGGIQQGLVVMHRIDAQTSRQVVELEFGQQAAVLFKCV